MGFMGSCSGSSYNRSIIIVNVAVNVLHSHFVTLIYVCTFVVNLIGCLELCSVGNIPLVDRRQQH